MRNGKGWKDREKPQRKREREKSKSRKGRTVATAKFVNGQGDSGGGAT